MYRGKSKKTGEWVYGYVIEYRGESFILPEKVKSFLGGFIEVIPESVGQWTGLKDKKEVDVYEGDIIRPWENDEFFSVSWNIEDAQWDTGNKRNKPYMSLGRLDFKRVWEIIGNTTDDPELLKAD